MTAATAASPTKMIDPAQVADEAARWAKPLIENLSDGFVALYLYGSAVDPGFDPAHSDVNLLLVAEALPATTIRKLSKVLVRLAILVSVFLVDLCLRCCHMVVVDVADG